MNGNRVPMNYFCWWLGQRLTNEGRPVIDKTGLDKFYDFTLSFRPVLPPDVSPENLPAGIQDRPTTFDALRQQLGLKLEPQKGPVEYFVIDGVQKPSTNYTPQVCDVNLDLFGGCDLDLSCDPIGGHGAGCRPPAAPARLV